VVLLLAIGLIPDSGCGPSQEDTAPERFSGTAKFVLDGDTIEVVREGETVRVRLHGIDCPEQGQPYADAAREFTSGAVLGQTVTVIVHDCDAHGRVVGQVVLADGRSLNHELVKAGLAWWYRYYAPNDTTLEKSEQEARGAGRGLWADDSPVSPAEFRMQKRASTARPEEGE